MHKRPLVSVDWLKLRLSDDTVKIVDGSWHLPPENRDGYAEYLKEHIPGAVFFDIDAISTPCDLPHMLPSVATFKESVGKLGLSSTHTVVVYDTKGLFSAARVWWMLKTFGFEDVRILNGGMPAWRASGLTIESGAVEVMQTTIEPAFNAAGVVNASEVLECSNALISGDNGAQILDARSQGRFDGVDPEPRAGLRAGHIPGSVCLPYTDLLVDGELKTNEALREVFDAASLIEGKSIITSCGSGVTAAILTLGLHCIGRDDCAVYDGSWTEWGGREDLPVVKS